MEEKLKIECHFYLNWPRSLTAAESWSKRVTRAFLYNAGRRLPQSTHFLESNLANLLGVLKGFIIFTTVIQLLFPGISLKKIIWNEKVSFYGYFYTQG